YLLVLSPNNALNSTSSGTFTVGKRETVTAPAVLGEEVNGEIATPGQSRQYSFTLTAPTTLVMNPLSHESYFYWSLVGPRGAEASSRYFSGDVYVNTLP